LNHSRKSTISSSCTGISRCRKAIRTKSRFSGTRQEKGRLRISFGRHIIFRCVIVYLGIFWKDLIRFQWPLIRIKDLDTLHINIMQLFFILAWNYLLPAICHN